MSWVMKIQWYLKPLEFKPDRSTITLEWDDGSGWQVVTTWTEYQTLLPYTYNITNNSGNYRVVVATSYHNRVTQSISPLVSLPTEETRPSRKVYPMETALMFRGPLTASLPVIERITFTILNVTRQEDLYFSPYKNLVEQEMSRVALGYIQQVGSETFAFLLNATSINNLIITRSSSITIGAV